MTINEVLTKVDRIKPNQLSEADKIGWLSDCDSSIFETVVRTHAPDAEMPDSFAGYAPDTDRDTCLLAQPPYDELYLYYLYMQIDYANMELSKYNNDAALYNAALLQYAAAYNRTHMPCHEATNFSL